MALFRANAVVGGGPYAGTTDQQRHEGDEGPVYRENHGRASTRNKVRFHVPVVSCSALDAVYISLSGIINISSRLKVNKQ
jgi:hypothetical protein